VAEITLAEVVARLEELERGTHRSGKDSVGHRRRHGDEDHLIPTDTGFGVVQHVQGSYTGNGGTQTIPVGFVPKVVVVKMENAGAATRYAAARTDTMSNAVALVTGATSAGISALGTTSNFTVVYNAADSFDTNESGIVYYWYAFGGEFCETGTFTGNGTGGGSVSVGATISAGKETNGADNPGLSTTAHTLDAGTNLLVVGVSTVFDTKDVASVTWNGVPMTRGTGLLDFNPNLANARRLVLFYLANPTGGPANVVVTMAAGLNGFHGVCVINLIGADVTNPFGTAVQQTATGTFAISSTLLSATDEICLDFVVTQDLGGEVLVVDAGQTQDVSDTVSNSNFGMSHEAGAASVTMGWHQSLSVGSANWAQLAVPINSSTTGQEISGVGFTPVMVWVLPSRITNSAVWKTTVMHGAASMEFLTADFLTNAITGLTSDGFTVGSGQVNFYGDTTHYVAFRASTNLSVGSYVGNGVDSRNLPTPVLPFNPEVVHIKRAASGFESVFRTLSMIGDVSYFYNATASTTDRIQSLTPAVGLFQVGTAGHVNVAGASYYFWASTASTSPGGFAPIGAQYLVLDDDPVLTAERVFTPGTGLAAVDGGAGGLYTLNVTGTGVDHGALSGLGDDDHPQYLTPAEHTAIGDASPHHSVYTLTVKEDNSPVDSAVTALDFTEPDATLVTSSPAGEANIAMSLYAILLGRSGQQTLSGQNVANGVLGLQGTSHATVTTARVDIIGSDLKMATAGRKIQDSGGTGRIALATSSPQVTLTGDVRGSAHAGFGGSGTVLTSVVLRASENFTDAAITQTGITSAISRTLTANRLTFDTIALNGSVTTSIEGFTTRDFIGCKYAVNIVDSSGAGGTVTGFYGAQMRIGFDVVFGTSLTITNVAGMAILTPTNVAASPLIVTDFAGLWIQQQDAFDGDFAITNLYGIRIDAQGAGGTVSNVYGIKMGAISNGTNRYGLHMGDIAAGTIARILELGPATPYLRLQGSGNWTPAANTTPLWVSEGATPTLRQFKTFNPGTAGINFTNGQLVVVLV